MLMPGKLTLFLLAVLLGVPAQAQTGFGRRGMGGDGPPRARMSTDGVERLEHAIKATGLTVVFRAGYACEPIASGFGSPTRYDGSARRRDRNGGLHGGVDISLPEGTPLLAVAAGEVVALGEGGRLEGIYLWLRHAPADTGLSLWTFAKYQHLSTLPALGIGDRVAAGQPIARSGSTGTAGAHYGAAGYPHLHLNTLYGRSGQYLLVGEYASQLRGEGAALDDPLILYAGVGDPAEVHAPSAAGKAVAVAVVGDDGAIHPAGSKLVWPVGCTAAKAPR